MRGLGVLALGAILSAALSDTFSRPEFLGQQDKLEHILAFSVLGFLFGWRASLFGLIGWALTLTGVACSIEILQKILTNTREAHLSDAFASLGGLALGLAAAWSAGAMLTRASTDVRPT